MKLIQLIFGLLFIGLTLNVDAQTRNCASHEVMMEQHSNDAKLAEKRSQLDKKINQLANSPEKVIDGILTIPIVFHVVYNTDAENISDAQIMTQLQVLNDDFRRLNSDANNVWSQSADTEIEFCLATVDPNGNTTTGITRTQTTQSSFGTNDNVKFTSSGGVDAWPTDQYLNVWVCDISGGILGYAQFPGGPTATDGVVNDYLYTGTIGTATNPYHLGRTLTHEVGHYLGLRHIWGDGGCSVDDFVNDTPTSDASNGGCNIGHVSCGTVDMVQNYMDYSYDACMNLFTQGQKDRMRSYFGPGGERTSLLEGGGCGTPPEPTCDDGIMNGNETGVDCGGICPETCPTCDDDIMNGNETGVDCGGDCDLCPCIDGEVVTVTIFFDNYSEETSWTLVDSNGIPVGNGGSYLFSIGESFSEAFCLTNGCYTFTIDDTYGDGICCGYGSGFYTVIGESGTVYAQGAEFGFTELTNFCISSTAEPTCEDGIMNGNETGIDCGGDCMACATCEDGIMNGDETGVDCGGDCAPCGEDCSIGVVNVSSFSNWGIWNDGGSDCRRRNKDNVYGLNGTKCVRLRDNTSSSVMTTDILDLSLFEEITISWTYLARSMENNEDFWLQISNNGGSSYTTVADYAANNEFVNEVREFEQVIINGPFSDNTRLRFRCDASGNYDFIYIDQVEIIGCSFGGFDDTTIDIDHIVDQGQLGANRINLDQNDLLLYPNPTSDVLIVQGNYQREGQMNFQIYDTSGRLVKVFKTEAYVGLNKFEIDVKDFEPGIYFLRVFDSQANRLTRFVVE